MTDPAQTILRRSRLGFTTVEFIGVMVISLILGTIAMAGFRLYQKELPVKYAARRIVHAFATARAFAIAHNSVYTVQIDRVHRNFWIDETDQVGRPTAPKVTRPEPIDERIEIEAIQFTQTAPVALTDVASVRFFPDGSSDDLRIFMKLELADALDDNNIYSVRLYGPTGQSRVFENQRLATPTPTPTPIP